MDNKRFPLIIPTILTDYRRIRRSYEHFFRFLPITRIIFIGPAELEQAVHDDANGYYESSIDYINENKIIPLSKVTRSLEQRLAGEGYQMRETSRPGWYYQQFLKLGYSRICEEEYYMTWDADTLPLRNIDMFTTDGTPYFDIKNEFHEGYFRTIKNLFGYNKVIQGSFVSEHMLFKKDYVLEMLSEIEKLSFPGEEYFEKIFYSIDIDNMKFGFSEFETFGTWVAMNHNNAYRIRRWNSIRLGGCFTTSSDLSEEDIRWLSKDYNTITFEGYNVYDPDLGALFRNPVYREKISFRQLYETVLESGYFGGYSNGVIKTENGEFPV